MCSANSQCRAAMRDHTRARHIGGWRRFTDSNTIGHGVEGIGYGIDDDGVLRRVELTSAEASAIQKALEASESVTVRDPQFID
jgi:hypothetical protein